MASLSAYAYGRSKEFGNERFYVDAFGLAKQNSPDDTGYSLTIRHKLLGEVMYLKENDTILSHNMEPASFLRLLKECKQKEYDVMKERRNAVKLAYQNKTKVHFGISKTKYEQLGSGYQKNFIDGLIGKDVYELAKPTFAKGKFVGFEISGADTKDRINMENLWKNANLKNKRACEPGFRFNAFETIYTSKIFNSKVYEQEDKNFKSTSTTIDIWWNSYLRLYN